MCYILCHVSFTDLLVTEIFHSLQGETSLSGVPFAFVRLSGCNLRCTYCDSAYAFKGGTRMSIAQVMNTVGGYDVKHVLLTGGEPLLQRQTPALAQALLESGYRVSIETHGETDPAVLSNVKRNLPELRVVMDIKTPSSRMNRGGWRHNLEALTPDDEIKFVIASPNDYAWAREQLKIVRATCPKNEVLFSPALPALGQPGSFEGVTPRWLAERILEDRLSVRFQHQLHKWIWGTETRGV